MKRAVTAVVLAALVVLAGCSASLDGTPLDGTDAGSATQADQGSINFYVSDERNAINDFQSLNVTITAVGFKKANTSESTYSPTESPTDSPTESPTDSPTESPTDSPTESPTVSPTESPTDSPTPTATPTATATEAYGGEVADKQGSGDWVVKQVDNRTVDLTELQGANASKLGTFGVEPGTYTKVFVFISDVDATLKNGEKVDVKLPSKKLQLNKRFTVGQDQSVDFVYDITVFKAGQSGSYILKPVVSQSGTDVPIEDVGKNGSQAGNGSQGQQANKSGEGAGKQGGDGQGADDKGQQADGNALNLTVLTENVTAGENATIEVTKAGEPVAGAEVKVNGETVGRTADDGTFTFTVPEGADEVEIEVKKAGQDASTTIVLSS